MRVCKHGCDVLDSQVFFFWEIFYKSNRALLISGDYINTRVAERILENYGNLRHVESLHNCLEFSQPSLCNLHEAM